MIGIASASIDSSFAKSSGKVLKVIFDFFRESRLSQFKKPDKQSKKIVINEEAKFSKNTETNNLIYD